MTGSVLRDLKGKPRLPQISLRKARLVSGLILMTFVVMHFANHALALISLDAAEAGRLWFMMVWRNPVGSLLLYGALFTHLTLVLISLYRRRTLVMPARELLQVIMGLALPVLLAEHVVGTRVFYLLSGNDDTYAYVAKSLWVWAPATGVRQVIAVVLVWGHGCLGVYFWLRHRPWFSTTAGYLLICAAVIPILALLGFVNAGRAVADAPITQGQGIDPALFEWATATKNQIVAGIYLSFVGSLILVFSLRLLRDRRERRNVVEVRYGDGRIVQVPRGHSVLEASRLGGVPHHSVCGGRGRCSTCRIKVVEGLGAQPAADAAEQSTLDRIHAERDVRLACQLRPTSDLTVIPLLAASRGLVDVSSVGLTTPGREQDVAVLFCDIRSFTALSDRKLPFDTVFLLNRYFAVVGSAVERAGGRLDKFIGDGAMAIFGLEVSKMEACRQALVAAAEILADLERVSQELSAELRAPLRIAIGIHAGPAIVGTMGYRHARGVTAIGDTVNIASRLEAVAKELDASIVMSASAAKLSGVDVSGYELRTVDIRGRSQPLRVVVVPQTATLHLGLDVPRAPVDAQGTP